jgi:branched-chain amino acid transport system substrate-binding protein
VRWSLAIAGLGGSWGRGRCDNISIGPGIQFNEKGQNDKLKSAAIQNRAGKFAIIAPNAQSDAKPELPMTPYDKRG